MVITILVRMPIIEDLDLLGDETSSSICVFSDAVFTNPSSLISYIHEIIITTGKPRMARTTRKLMVHAGIFNAGIIIWAAWRSTKAVAR